MNQKSLTVYKHEVYTKREVAEAEYARTVEEAYKLYSRESNRDPQTKTLSSKLEEARKTLQLHLEVYVTADRLDIALLPRIVAEKALDILLVAELLIEPRLDEYLGYILDNTSDNDTLLRIPIVGFFFSKQDLITTFNKPLDAVLQVREPLAYGIAKRANYYEAESSINTRLGKMLEKIDQKSIVRIPDFFNEDKWSPESGCGKMLSRAMGTLYRNYMITATIGTKLGEQTIMQRQRTFFRAHCHSWFCKGMVYAGINPNEKDPDTGLEQWKELATEAEILVKPNFRIYNSAVTGIFDQVPTRPDGRKYSEVLLAPVKE